MLHHYTDKCVSNIVQDDMNVTLFILVQHCYIQVVIAPAFLMMLPNCLVLFFFKYWTGS